MLNTLPKVTQRASRRTQIQDSESLLHHMVVAGWGLGGHLLTEKVNKTF